MKTYSIPEDVLNETLQYLSKQPYIEVAPLIQKIGGAIEATPKPNLVVAPTPRKEKE